MKLLQIGPYGEEKPAVLLDDGHLVDVSDEFPSFDRRFFADGGLTRVADVAARKAAAGLRTLLDGTRIGAPIAWPHQIICVGLNYLDHARETGQPSPAEPILFNKSPNTLIGPDDAIQLPRDSTKTDWEVELGVVIGQQASYLCSDDEARAAIAGYVLVNDVSEREFQLERGGQWMKGKSAATFNPCGPYLVTADEIPDPQELDLWLDVNGVARQRGSTANMIFDVLAIVRYVSQFMVLEPGDLINTGTPAGVGMGLTPPSFLRDGDVVSLGITGLGEQRQSVIGAPPASF